MVLAGIGLAVANVAGIAGATARTVEQLWELFDAYNETSSTKRKPAIDLLPAVKDSMSEHLNQYLTDRRDRKLNTRVQGSAKCLAALFAGKAGAPDLNNPGPCGHCQKKRWLCIAKPIEAGR